MTLNNHDNISENNFSEEQKEQYIKFMNELNITADTILNDLLQTDEIEIPNLKEIYEKNKLVINNKDTINLIQYIEFLKRLLKSCVMSRILDKMAYVNQQKEEYDKNGTKQ